MENDHVPPTSPSEHVTPESIPHFCSGPTCSYCAIMRGDKTWDDVATHDEMQRRFHKLLEEQRRYHGGDLYDGRGRRVRPRESWLQWRRRQLREKVYDMRRGLADRIEP